MTPEEFKEKGCYQCGGHNFEQPRIAMEDKGGGPQAVDSAMPVRDPYLLCMDCKAEYPFPDIMLLNDDTWEYGREHRSGDLAIPTTYYKSEAQFDPAAMSRGFLTKEEEDVARPG